MTPPSLDTARVSTEVVVGALARDRRRVAADLIALAKPRVVLMVMVTTAVGYYVGLTGAPDYARLVHLLIGTLLAAGGTLPLNQYWERDVDARMYRDDYARAGVRLLPVVDAAGTSTERQIVTGCLALLAVSLLPTLIGLAGPIYFVGAFLLGGAFVVLGARQALTPSAGSARRGPLGSLLYLPVLLALLAFDKV